MRCIFCRGDTTASVSREHIVPESLGNTLWLLPRGVVCDKCNNYFAREVEKPFLMSPAVRSLRFSQELENKRGRVPSIPGIIMPNVPVTVTRHPRINLTSVDVPQAFYERFAGMKDGSLILPLGGREPPERVTSRFMAKVAIEALAKRIFSHDGGQDYICDEGQLDLLRDHARTGRTSRWPVYVRTIYDANAKVSVAGGPPEQLVHEFDFLPTLWGEWFFTLVLFGLELTINIGGPDIEGYERWLLENNNISPLYRPEKPGSYPMPTSTNDEIA